MIADGRGCGTIPILEFAPQTWTTLALGGGQAKCVSRSCEKWLARAGFYAWHARCLSPFEELAFRFDKTKCHIMKLRHANKSESGSTLTEVIFAVTILAICMSGLMGALASGFLGMKLTRENQRATQILMEETEMLRLYNWDQINDPGFIPTHFTTVYDPQKTDGGGLIYTGTVAITSVPFTASYSTNLRQLTLTLTWQSTKDILRTRTTTTLVSKDGLQNYVY
jgi:type II secretory pathway pseudopilin PulG